MAISVRNPFFSEIEDLLVTLEHEEGEHIKQAAKLISDSIMSGGILQAFGSGHSQAAAMEICGRAGGLIPSKLIIDPSYGMYEMVQGVGDQLMKRVDIRANDCVVIVSNSGRNPLNIEMAMHVKRAGASLIVVTALEVSKSVKSRHSSGKKLYEFADVILDNHGVYGDAAIHLSGMPVKVGSTSSIASAMLLNASTIEAMEIMIANNCKPPVLMSANIDGGREFNEKLLRKYEDRINRY